MQTSLRESLAESHVSAVTIAVLLIWSLDSGFQALWGPLSRAVRFLFTAVAILDIPYFSTSFNGEDRILLNSTLLYLFHFLITLAAAWLLSRWVYGEGPLRSLGTYGNRLIRSKHV